MTLEESERKWTAYDWSRKGDEWSDAWGGADAQWHGTILPRIRLGTVGTVLEIGCGYGKWVPYFGPHCVKYQGVDICSKCIENCQKEFPELDFWLNDGRTLNMIEDGSVDFVFSYDSLVHADADTMEVLVPQIVAKLSPLGKAFIHHSNWGDKLQPDQWSENLGLRSEVDCGWVAAVVKRSGGRVRVQEKIAWVQEVSMVVSTRRCGDAYTLFGKALATFASEEDEFVVLTNPYFMDEVERARQYIRPYDA